MNQSTSLSYELPARDATGLHVAIIMDGNGRWAQARGLPRGEGHRQGGEAVRRTVEAAPELGIGTLTLYAFSCDNWKRPAQEVRGLMGLFRRYLKRETQRCAEQGVRLQVVGRRDRLDAPLRSTIQRAEAATRGGRRLALRIAVDYSARDATLRAAGELAGCRDITADSFGRAFARAIHAGDSSPEVDLLIRTGGEWRLSDLLGWDSAYAELVFSERMWPDFDAADLRAAVGCFRKRERRFGGLPQPRPGEAAPFPSEFREKQIHAVAEQREESISRIAVVSTAESPSQPLRRARPVVAGGHGRRSGPAFK